MLRHLYLNFSTLVCFLTFSLNVFANINPRPTYEVPTKNEELKETPQPDPTTADSVDLTKPNELTTGFSDFFPTSFDEIRFMPGLGLENNNFYSLLRLETSFPYSNYSSWTYSADIQFRAMGSLSVEHTWRYFKRGWFPFFDLGFQLGLNPKLGLSNLLDKSNLYLYCSGGVEKIVNAKNKLIFQLTLGSSFSSLYGTILLGYTFPL